MNLKNKVAIVTGGAGGIGRATVERLAKKGASVLLADLSPQGDLTAQALAAQGLDVVFQTANVSTEADVAAMVEKALSHWGRLDIMVANAGISGRGTADETDLADWQKVMAVNLTGVFLCTKYAVPAMRANGGGAIVNVASIMGLVATKGAVPYAATKGALINMTRSTALDYAQENIRVNAVCPGHLVAPTSMGGAEARLTSQQELLDQYPMGRLASPEDVASAIAFLASEEAAFITGVSLAVDGGYTAK